MGTNFFDSKTKNKEDNDMEKQTFCKILMESKRAELENSINEVIAEYPDYRLSSISYTVDSSQVVNRLDHPNHLAACIFERRES